MDFYGSTRSGPLYEGVEMSTDPGDGWKPRYRATIVPDGTGDVYGTEGKAMTMSEALQWLKDYAEVSGVPDLKKAVCVIEERMESIL